MKTSALRRWLREERARENAEALNAMSIGDGELPVRIGPGLEAWARRWVYGEGEEPTAAAKQRSPCP
jgi:hypothetical protein